GGRLGLDLIQPKKVKMNSRGENHGSGTRRTTGPSGREKAPAATQRRDQVYDFFGGRPRRCPGRRGLTQVWYPLERAATHPSESPVGRLKRAERQVAYAGGTGRRRSRPAVAGGEGAAGTGVVGIDDRASTA